MIDLMWEVVLMVVQLVLGFYGFWFTWRVLLPILPSPDNAQERIAPFAVYYTEPFVDRILRVAPINQWLATFACLIGNALLMVVVAYY